MSSSFLERGFALVRQASGQVVRDASDVTPGDPLQVRLARGEMEVRVESSSPPEDAALAATQHALKEEER